jgi:putative ATP-binding cassette transporter
MVDRTKDPGRGAAPARNGVLRRTVQLASGYYTSEEKWSAWGLTVVVLALTLLQIAVQVRFNFWNRDFFEALESRDIAAFYGQMWLFVGLALAGMTTAVFQLYARQTLQLRWRRWLVYRLQHRWLGDGRHYQLNFLPGAADNPDQRISENTRWATAMAVDMAIGLLQAALTLAFFIGILWTLSGPLYVMLGASEFTIPGYMVLAAVIYAGLGSGLTYLIGRPMVDINFRRNQAEADHRYAMARLRENSEAVALIRGESDEERGLQRAFVRVVSVMKELYSSERRLMALTSVYWMLASVFPILVASPRYFAGAITLGVLMQIANAFGEVTRSLNWFVENFPKIADWHSHVERVVELEDTLDAADELEAEGTIEVVEGPAPAGGEVLAFDHLRVATAGGHAVISEASVEVSPAEKVLIIGESGSGKSTLFRAIAGVWPWGAGRIRVPPREHVMFMPQRPYIPLGTLRAAVCYPAAPQQFSDAAIRAALQRCNLPLLVERLAEEDRWDRILSLGEQQRLAFARLLLHKPGWVFMDEATAALDEANQDAIMRLFEEDLAEMSVVSIGHQPGLEAHHRRTLSLVRFPDGARLEVRRRREHPPQRNRPMVAAGRGALRRLLRRDRLRP